MLVVDDDDLTRQAVAQMAADVGFLAVEAASAEAAVALLTSRPDITVLLSDIEMPGVDGVALSWRVRQEWPSARIILMSGRQRPGPEQTPAGVRYLAKPFRLADLARALAG
jgi:CheY-like chemotaxis protein